MKNRLLKLNVALTQLCILLLFLSCSNENFDGGDGDNTEPKGNVIIDVSEVQEPINKDLGGRVMPLTPEDIQDIPLTLARPGWGRWIIEGNLWPAEGVIDWDSRWPTLIRNFTNRGLRLNLALANTPEWLWIDDPTVNDPVPGIFSITRKGHTLPPNDWDKWEELIYETVKHVVDDMGVKGIYWEVWNEPDVLWFWNGTKEQLIEVYDHTARAIKRADPTALVGGPTVAKLQPSFDWVQDLLKHCAENDVPLDFIAYHEYLYYEDSASRVLTFDEQAELIRKEIEKYPQLGQVGLAITEWGYDWNYDRADVIDSPFHGAYIVQSLREMQDNDYLFATFCSHTGTVDNPNPVRQALKMHGHLDGNRISADVQDNPSVGAIASKSGNRTSILLWDYPFQMSTPSLETTTKELRLNVQHLEPGEYDLTRYLVDDNTSATDNSLVIVDEKTINITNNSSIVDLEFDLIPYAVSLITLDKK